MAAPLHLNNLQGIAFLAMGGACVALPGPLLRLSLTGTYGIRVHSTHSHTHSHIRTRIYARILPMPCPILRLSLTPGAAAAAAASDKTSRLIFQCFGAQAMLAGLLLTTARLSCRGFCLWALAMLPFLIFDAAKFRDGTLSAFGAGGDAAGNLLFVALSAYGEAQLGHAERQKRREAAGNLLFVALSAYGEAQLGRGQR